MLLIFWGRSFFVAGSVLQPGAVGGWGQGSCLINWRAQTRASNEGYPKVPEDFTITEKAPTRALSWLNAPTSAFTFKTLLRHYAKWDADTKVIRDGLVLIVFESHLSLMIIASILSEPSDNFRLNL